MKITGSFRLGTFFRTRIRIHYTWLLVFLLIPWSMSTQFSTETDITTRIGLGVITAVVFFFAIFLREIILLIVANYKGIKVNILTIFAFGGLIQTDSKTESPSLVMLLAVSGMLMNFLITILFYFSALFINEENSFMMYVSLKWLSFFFLTLSLFHLIPAYPLEGGRMLHVLFWKLTGNLRKATRISGVIGWMLGFLTMVGGIILAIFTSELFTGLFFTGLGLIMQNAATHCLRAIGDITVPVPLPIEDDMTETPLMDEPVLEAVSSTDTAVPFEYFPGEERLAEVPSDAEVYELESTEELPEIITSDIEENDIEPDEHYS